MLVLKHRDTAVNSLAFSPDGSALAAGGYWGYLHLWDLASRTLRREQRLGTWNVASVFFAAEGRLAAFNGGYLNLFETKTGDAVERLRLGRNMTPTVFAPAPWPGGCFYLPPATGRVRHALGPGGGVGRGPLIQGPGEKGALGAEGERRDRSRPVGRSTGGLPSHRSPPDTDCAFVYPGPHQPSRSDVSSRPASCRRRNSVSVRRTPSTSGVFGIGPRSRCRAESSRS